MIAVLMIQVSLVVTSYYLGYELTSIYNAHLLMLVLIACYCMLKESKIVPKRSLMISAYITNCTGGCHSSYFAAYFYFNKEIDIYCIIRQF